jgi:hypothetical protein
LTFPTIEDLHTSLVAIPLVLLALLAAQSATHWLTLRRKWAEALCCGLVLLALYLSLTSATLASARRSWPTVLPMWTALNGLHEVVA